MIVFITFWSLLSAFSCAAYYIFFKKAEDKLVFSFWGIGISTAGFLATYVLKTFIAGESLGAFNSEVITLFTTNVPYYLLDAVAMVISMFFYAYLLTKFQVSQLIPVLQIGTPIVALLYYFLGNPTSASSIFSIGFITIGAMISGFDKFYFPNIFKPFFLLPLALYLGGLWLTFLDIANTLFIYVTTEKTAATIALEKSVESIPALHTFKLGFTSSLDFYQGSYVFYFLLMLLTLLFYKNYSLRSLWNGLLREKSVILWGGITNLVSSLAYLYVYQVAPDKSLIVALTQFSVPLTLALAYIHLNEEITVPQKVGALLIIGGGVIGIL